MLVIIKLEIYFMIITHYSISMIADNIMDILLIVFTSLLVFYFNRLCFPFQRNNGQSCMIWFLGSFL